MPFGLNGENIMENNILPLPEQSEKVDVILTQLMKAKNEMGCAVRKDSTNPFHKSKYASLGAHLELSEPILFRYGLIMIQASNVINNQSFLVATLHHPESNQWIKSYLPLPNPKNDSQGIGAAISYMRRYAINSMLGLNAEDDDGETADGRGKNVKKTPEAQNNLPPSPLIIQNNPGGKVQKIDNIKLVELRNLDSKLNKECKEKLYSWLKQKYKINQFDEILEEFFPIIYLNFKNAVKYIESEKKVVNA